MLDQNPLYFKKTLLLFFSGMMEMTWLYILLSFLHLVIEYPPIPLWSAFIAFFTPLCISSVLEGRGKRMISYVFLNLLFSFSILLYTLYDYENWHQPFSISQWLNSILNGQDRFSYCLIAITFSIFWINGLKLFNRENNYSVLTSRFDLGILIMVCIFILSGAMDLQFSYATQFIFYYFLFSLLSIVLVKNVENTKYLQKNNQTSLSILFIMTVLIFGSWILLFFSPQLTVLAQASYNALKIIGNPVGQFLLKILSLMFRISQKPLETSSVYPSDQEVIPLVEAIESPWWWILLTRIIVWGGILFIILIGLLLTVWLLWLIGKWLSTKSNLNVTKNSVFNEFLSWLEKILNLSKVLLKKIIKLCKHLFRKPKDILDIFQNLCRWGYYTGIPKPKNMTPQEYGTLLTSFFPNSQSEIQAIIISMHQEVYGGKPVSKEQFREVVKAWKSLSSPAKWLNRLWIRLISIKRFSFQETNL